MTLAGERRKGQPADIAVVVGEGKLKERAAQVAQTFRQQADLLPDTRRGVGGQQRAQVGETLLQRGVQIRVEGDGDEADGLLGVIEEALDFLARKGDAERPAGVEDIAAHDVVGGAERGEDMTEGLRAPGLLRDGAAGAKADVAAEDDVGAELDAHGLAKHGGGGASNLEVGILQQPEDERAGVLGEGLRVLEGDERGAAHDGVGVGEGGGHGRQGLGRVEVDGQQEDGAAPFGRLRRLHGDETALDGLLTRLRGGLFLDVGVGAEEERGKQQGRQARRMDGRGRSRHGLGLGGGGGKGGRGRQEVSS